jgi:hypothetical protein
LDSPPEPSNIAEFPRRIDEGDRALLDELTHRKAVDTPLDLFDALDLLQRESLAPDRPGSGLTRIKERLRLIFAGRETITEAELRDGMKRKKFKAVG